MRQLFKPTVFIANIEQLDSLKIGQWIQFDSGIRGQYLGTTKHGTDCVRYQNDKFAKLDAKANKPLRQYAKMYGSR